jgi:Na+/H+-dicarboxylate symporter
VNAAPAARRPFYRSSTFLIFIGLTLGVILGGFLPADAHPHAAAFFRFLSKAFISLIKSIIVPILLSTIVVGIAQTGDLRAVGRMGGKALLYFEIVTTLALFIGLFVAELTHPGLGLPLQREAHAELAQPKSGWDVALHTFPSNVVKHAADGDILPVVVFATLFGVALTRIGDRGKPVLAFFDGLADVMLRYTDMIMSLTPLGVFGAMAYNVSHMAAGQTVAGRFVKGWGAVGFLLQRYSVLVASLYLALALLVLLVFVPIMLVLRIKVRAFFRAIRDPALTAFSTASSEAALPKLLEQLIAFGVPRRVRASCCLPATRSTSTARRSTSCSRA